MQEKSKFLSVRLTAEEREPLDRLARGRIRQALEQGLEDVQ